MQPGTLQSQWENNRFPQFLRDFAPFLPIFTDICPVSADLACI
jgi:hypothetical protein